MLVAVPIQLTKTFIKRLYLKSIDEYLRSTAIFSYPCVNLNRLAAVKSEELYSILILIS